jgi:hypothetical protein
MAVVLMEGFDHYPAGSSTAAGGLSGRWAVSTTTAWTFPAGRIAGLCARRSGSGAITMDRALPSELTSLAVGVAFHIDTAAPGSATQEFISLRSSGGAQLVIGVTTTGLLQVGRASFSSILGTEAEGNPLQAEAWYYLEIEAVIHGSTGSVKVYKNGAEVINVSGVNTKGQSQDGVSTLRLRMPGTAAWAASSFDDVYVADAATRLGDSRVITLVPDSDTADKDWSPSSGQDNYAMVDEEQVDGDTSYVASSTPGDLDFYTMGNLGVTPETIHAVQLMMCACKDDAATREVRLKLKSGATVEDGPTQALSTSYQYFHEIYDADPDAEGPWTATAVDAMQAGVETVT